MFHLFAFQNESTGKNIPVFYFVAVEMVQLKNVIKVSIKHRDNPQNMKSLVLWVAIVKRGFVDSLFCKKFLLNCKSVRFFKVDSLPKKHGGHCVLTLNDDLFFVVQYYPLYNTILYNISLSRNLVNLQRCL